MLNFYLPAVEQKGGAVIFRAFALGTKGWKRKQKSLRGRDILHPNAQISPDLKTNSTFIFKFSGDKYVSSVDKYDEKYSREIC